MSLYRPGLRRISFLFLSLIAMTLAACAQPILPAHGQTISPDPVVRWIQHHAISLRTTNPGGSDADLAPLKQIAASASIVGLGEETHGTHEFITMKARLAEFLISKMGFTTFVMENGWGDSKLIDAYINGGPGKITDVMARNLYGSWQTEEYRDLLEWMRAYNADPAHTTKIHFLGMDMQDLNQNDLAAVENYLRKVDPGQVATVQELYAPLLAISGPGAYDKLAQVSASDKQRYQDQARRVYDLLQTSQEEYTRRSSSQEFAFALQNARIVTQFATYNNANTDDESLTRYFQRDGFMAENVAWIHDHAAGSNPKVIVWAHDAHIANDTYYGSQDGRNMGGELRASYGDGYLAIGTTLYRGAFRSYTSFTGTVQKINPPASDTYNYTLGQAGLPVYMLDLRQLPAGPVSNWANNFAPFLEYGLAGEDLSSPAALGQLFDVIVHIQDTTPSIHF